MAASLAQYQAMFRREVYALVRDAYEESFTPGSDSVKTPNKPITVKPDLYRQCAFIAMSKLAREGHKAPAGFSIEKEQGSVFSQGGATSAPVQNPSTPRMFAHMYEKAPFFQRFFGLKKNPVSAEQDLFQQFKSTHQHMASLYFTRNGMPREKFAFQKGMQNTEQLKEVVLNQYRNYVMSITILALVQKAYELTPGQIDEILSATGAKAMNFKQLDDNATRLAFGEALSGILKDLFNGQNLGGAIIAKIKTGKS